jgi:hypothetical protein
MVAQAIKDCCSTGVLDRRSNDAGITVAPIVPVAGIGTRLTTLEHKHGPIAVMLDLMNPVSAFGRLVN